MPTASLPLVPTLGYATTATSIDPPLPSGPRPWWVYGVVAIYLLLLGGMLTMPIWAAFTDGNDVVLPAAIFVAALFGCGWTLILLPVRALRLRPVRRRSIWLPVIVSGLLGGALVFGAGIALYEFFRISGDAVEWALVLGAVCVWAGWSIVFMLIVGSNGPGTIGMKLHRLLIAGSALELLIAVPAHVVVRRRNECCAGIETGIGICIGVGVMFISFGPSVLVLYHRRRKRITPPRRR